jgi:hypothetical protein
MIMANLLNETELEKIIVAGGSLSLKQRVL